VRLDRHAGEVAYAVWRNGPITKTGLAEKLGLSLPTISTAISELQRFDLIEASATGPSTGGRKARLLDVRSDKGRIIGVSLTSRGIAAATGNLKGQLRHVRQYPFVPANGKQAAIDGLFRAVQDQLNLEPGSAPLRIGLSISGLLDRSRGISLGFPRFDEWVRVPVVALMQERFGLPVTLDNHIAGTTLAELLFGNHRPLRNAIYAQLGPGLGMGIIINGELYRGEGPNIGEFGHTSMREDGGPLCYCGNYGCLESLAGDHAVVQQAMAGLKVGVQTMLSDQGADAGRLSIRDIFRAAASGDRFAMNLVERAARLLGAGIANVSNLLAPDVIILGGTMMDAGDLLMDSICKTLDTKSLNRVEKHLQVRKDSFGRDDTVTGAVATALHQHFSQGLDQWKFS
jgi:predicted NBD/HSP70 family sugar kinase